MSAGGIKMWDTATGAELRRLIGPEQYVGCLALSQDGKLLATGGPDGTVFLWDVRSGKFREQLLKDKGWIRSVCFSPDGRTLVAGRQNPNPDGQGSPDHAIVWSIDPEWLEEKR